MTRASTASGPAGSSWLNWGGRRGSRWFLWWGHSPGQIWGTRLRHPEHQSRQSADQSVVILPSNNSLRIFGQWRRWWLLGRRTVGGTWGRGWQGRGGGLTSGKYLGTETSHRATLQALLCPEWRGRAGRSDGEPGHPGMGKYFKLMKIFDIHLKIETFAWLKY